MRLFDFTVKLEAEKASQFGVGKGRGVAVLVRVHPFSNVKVTPKSLARNPSGNLGHSEIKVNI